MKLKLTLILIIAVLPLMTGCRETPESVPARQRLVLTHTHQGISEDTCCRIKFSSEKKKDAETRAMERAAAQWNRNLYMLDSYASLDEYVEIYSRNP